MPKYLIATVVYLAYCALFAYLGYNALSAGPLVLDQLRDACMPVVGVMVLGVFVVYQSVDRVSFFTPILMRFENQYKFAALRSLSILLIVLPILPALATILFLNASVIVPSGDAYNFHTQSMITWIVLAFVGVGFVIQTYKLLFSYPVKAQTS